MEALLEFNDKVALITGAASGFRALTGKEYEALSRHTGNRQRSYVSHSPANSYMTGQTIAIDGVVSAM